MPVWRNWDTLSTQNRSPLRDCGFDSHHRHQMKTKRINPNKFLQAYVIGLALGDGNLSNPNGRGVRLRISCDAKYPKLIFKIQKTLKLLLPDNKIALIKRKANCVDVSCYSNFWPKILNWKHLGSKYAQSVDVPIWIKTNNKCSILCLRGLIETDGSIYKDRGYKMVMFSSVIPNLAKSFKGMTEQLGFEAKVYEIIPKSKFNSKKIYHIRISKDVENFLKLIKPQKS